MGKKPRERPQDLHRKLFAIRQQLGLSQSEILYRLQIDVSSARISEYKLGVREPPLKVLLRYARLAGVSTATLIDDDLSLPQR